MESLPQPFPHRPQTGAITIMVALMMLVLLTIAAIGMSRNSFKDVVTSGFTRQGAMSNNVADSGLEWAVYWFDLRNSTSAADTALQLNQLKASLAKNDSLAGLSRDLADPSGNTPYVPGGNVLVALPSPTGVTQGYTMGLTRMGKLPITDTSQGNGPGAFSPASGAFNAQAPDLWAVRADAQVSQGSVTFTHASEAWISTPVQ